MKTAIHLKTARVSSTDTDGTPKIERLTVKLTDGINFNKFVRHMYLQNYLKKEPPFVAKVIQEKGGEWVEIDKTPWQEIVEKELLSRGKPVIIDYKALSEQQSKEIEGLKSDFEDRLASLEKGKAEIKKDFQIAKSEIITNPSNRSKLEQKATELKVKFRTNIGDKKLLEKIQAIEPDFKI